MIFGMGNSRVGRLIDAPLISLTTDYVEMGKQAVRLWRYLYKDGTDTEFTVSIACRMNRKIADKEIAVSRCSINMENILPEMKECADDWNDDLYEDEKVKKLHLLEKLLQSCDETDLFLLHAINQDKTDEVIAEEISMTPRAVRYRIGKMMKKINAANRREITVLLKEFDLFGG